MCGMPHTTVEYSASVADAFDRPAFAKGLHEAVVSIADGRAAVCQTRFLRLDETYIADGSPHYAMIHVTVALFAGRVIDVKRELRGAVLALLRQHTAPTPTLSLQFSVEVRDFDREVFGRHDELRSEM